MRILVIDDDPDLLAVTEQRLASAGFDVLTASNGGDALAILTERDVDILFADLLMPGMSGLELAHQAQRRHRHVKVILTSGGVPLDTALPGGMQFLKKPYQFADLISAIRKAS